MVTFLDVLIDFNDLYGLWIQLYYVYLQIKLISADNVLEYFRWKNSKKKFELFELEKPIPVSYSKLFTLWKFECFLEHAMTLQTKLL